MWRLTWCYLLVATTLSVTVAFSPPHSSRSTSHVPRRRLVQTRPDSVHNRPSMERRAWLEPFQAWTGRIRPQTFIPNDIVSTFVEAYNLVDIPALSALLFENSTWDDYHSCYQPLVGMDAIERFLRLQKGNGSGQTIQVDDIVEDESTVGFTFTSVLDPPSTLPLRGVVVLQLCRESPTRTRIIRVSMVREKALKLGPYSLAVLSAASRVVKSNDNAPSGRQTPLLSPRISTAMSPPEQYFAAWNSRDIVAAANVFTPDIYYDDTAFPDPLVGRQQVADHLTYCASCFPDSFAFVMDAKVGSAKGKAMITSWHVEDNGKPLPFTRGISYYELDGSKIKRGIDFVDSEPVKVGRALGIIKSWVQVEPARWIPIVTWLAYMYIVFVSDGILPGANALQLEARTWEEVLNLSLNFFLVAPVLNLPFSPVVHPMLEGVFNLLLSWAAMFAGFLSDDRRTKPNLLPMLPIVIGMQFLTSAFLLPYLATRTSEPRDADMIPTMDELPMAAQIAEARVLGPAMALVGSYSIVWAIVGRGADFGDLSVRWASFLDLLSIDRVGSSFLVDLVIFAAFQGWLVDDDMKRRGVELDEKSSLRLMAKYIPFFGMALYLMLRPPIPSERIE